MLGKVVATSSVISMVLVVVLLQVTNPASIGPLGIFVLFVLVYVSVLGVLTYLLYGVSRIVARIASTVTAKRPLQPLSFRRAYYFSSVLTLAPIMLIGLHSVGEVGVYEVLLVVIFVIVGCVYTSKRTS
jgi:hypothetical protein